MQNFGVLITNTSALPAGVLLMKDSTLSILVFFLFLASWPRKMSIMARRSRLESRKHLRELRVAPKRKNLKSPGRGVKRFYCRWPRSKLPERAQLVHDHSSASRPRLPHFSSKCDERRKIRCNKASPPETSDIIGKQTFTKVFIDISVARIPVSNRPVRLASSEASMLSLSFCLRSDL